MKKKKRLRKGEKIIVVPAKSVEGARKQWKGQGTLLKWWVLKRIRLATKKEFPYERTRGYRSYALIVAKKKKSRGRL